MGLIPNNFIIIKLITIILVYVSRLKKNLFCFLFIYAATLCSLLFILFSMHSSLLAVFFFSKRLLLGYSLFFFFFVRLPLSLLLHILSLCLLEGGSTLLSPSSCIPPKQKSLFSFLVSCFIFPLPIGRTLRPKPSNSL